MWRHATTAVLFLALVLGPSLGDVEAGQKRCFGKKATIKDDKGFIQGTPGNDVIIGD
jgi:hypothetical protein